MTIRNVGLISLIAKQYSLLLKIFEDTPEYISTERSILISNNFVDGTVDCFPNLVRGHFMKTSESTFFISETLDPQQDFLVVKR